MTDVASLSWVSPNVPDPGEPLPRPNPESLRTLGRRWIAQNQRRARILAAARSLMIERDFDQVHLHDVARQCGISVQTIYNIVGNRAEMMGASAAEWVEAIGAAARQEAAERNGSMIFSVLAMFWSAALARPDYVGSAVRTSECDPRRGPLRQTFYRSGTSLFTAELTRLRDQGGVRERTDVPSLARQLTLSANATICAWTLNPYPVPHFLADLLNGPGMMLAGALQRDELGRLERSMAAMS